MKQYEQAISEIKRSIEIAGPRPLPLCNLAYAQANLERDILALVGQFNRSGDGTMVVPSDYLEIVIVRR